jgi:tRNA modification GTPase
MDLVGGRASAPRLGADLELLPVSAAEGTGLDALRARLAEAVGAGEGREAVVVTSARHAELLRGAAEELLRADMAVELYGDAWEDRAACHLRESLRALGAVLGEGASDEALHQVFSRFCVGK